MMGPLIQLSIKKPKLLKCSVLCNYYVKERRFERLLFFSLTFEIWVCIQMYRYAIVSFVNTVKANFECML